MQATAFASVALKWIMLVGLSGGMGLPLGVPPLPEDPLLARVAPAECVFYTTWAGAATPDAKSANQTEQLLAEPEVQRLVAEIERRIREGLNTAAKREGPEAEKLAEDAAGWAKTLLTRPTALFLSSLKVNPGGPPEVRGGAIVGVGDDAAKLKSSLEKYQTTFLGAAAQPVEIGGETWYRLQLGPGAPPITWGVKGKYLIAGIGEGEVEAILKRARATAPPAWLAGLRKQLPVDRTATVSYVNVKALVDTTKALVDTLSPMGGPQAQAVIEAVGLGNLTSLAAVTGLDKTGFVSRTLLVIDGEPAGVLSLASGKPLAAADLAPIPADATIAMAARIDADQVFETILGIVGKVEPRARQEALEGIESVKTELGLSIRDDLLKPLGDTWCIYNSPGEGGLVFTGLTAVAKVADAARLAKVQEKLLAALKHEFHQDEAVEARGRRPRPRVEQFEFAGRQVYFLNAREKEFPFAPAWCLTDKELIVALFPQNVKAYLSRDAKFQSLAKVPEVAAMFQGDAGPVCLSYADTPKLAEMLYPLAPMIAQVVMTQLQREGIDVNVSIVPSATAILPHVRPTFSTVRRTKAGIQIDAHQSLPGGSIGATGPIAVALLLPAVQSARASARRASSMNNLRQLSQALMNYEATHKKFPPAYTTDKEGKPLLSWRVLILPYMKEKNLYEQFHLDEPWDSEHNKTLIPQIPVILRNPDGSAGPAGPGKTNYLTVRGEKTVFPGKEGVLPAQVRDGMSNTIMLVEVGNSKAVPWTKPDDFQYDEKNPIAGLVGLRPGGFSTAFCDGSVRFISSSISPDVLKALFTRDGGEAINQGEF